jgi:hypothetical protein
VYAVTREATYRYEPATHQLLVHARGDARAALYAAAATLSNSRGTSKMTKDEGRETKEQPPQDKLLAQMEALRAALRERDPRDLAFRCGIELSDGMFRIPFFGAPYIVTFPDLEVRVEATQQVCAPYRAAMFLYYLHTADGTPLAGKWIAFRDLPDGLFYHQAYQGYSGNRLARAMGNRLEVFERAAHALGGMRLALGDAAFAFDALPRVRVAAVYYAGDEDFPATANVLFDESSSHYLPTDGLASIGSALVDRLIGAMEVKRQK